MMVVCEVCKLLDSGKLVMDCSDFIHALFSNIRHHRLLLHQNSFQSF